MNHPIPTLTVAAVAAATVVTACFGSRNPQHACGRMAADAATADSSDGPDPVVLRVLAKDLVARDVLAGRRSVAQAVALVRELNARAGPIRRVTQADRGEVARHQLAEIVQGSVGWEMGMNPAYARQAVAELEAAISQERVTHVAVGSHSDPDPREVDALIERARARLERDRAGASRTCAN